MDTTATVFISYRSVDVDIAKKIHDRLQQQGILAWLDLERLKPGILWHDAIRNAADKARVMLPLVTPNWKESEWTRFETYGAEFVIPLLCYGDWEQVAPGPLRGSHYFDCRDLDTADFTGVGIEIRQRLAIPPASQADRLISIPYLQNAHFVGRDEILLQLHESFWELPTAALSQSKPHVVSGLGGVGKTTIAREYIERFWRSYDDIIWIHAEPHTLIAELARIGPLTGAFEHPSGDAALDARRTLQALQQHRPRLLVLDNVLDEETVQPWIPKTGGCRVLITTRTQDWSPGVRKIEMPVLGKEAAIRFLIERTDSENNSDNQQRSVEICTELGFLPLAMEQAAAFMLTYRIPLDQYLQTYRESAKKLLNHHSLGSAQYPDSVAETWWTSMSFISDQTRSALVFLSFLAPDRIPLTALQYGLSEPEGIDWHPLDILTTRERLAPLADLSLIKLGENHASLHRLLRKVVQDTLSKAERRQWGRWIVHSLQATMQESAAGMGDLIHHVEEILQLGEDLAVDPDASANILQMAGNWLLFESSQHRRSKPVLETFLNLARNDTIDERILGHGLPAIASVYWYDGNYQRALDLAEEAYEIASNHELIPTTEVRIADILGCLYNDLGSYSRSEQVFDAGLEFCNQHLEKSAPARGWLLNEKAWLYRDMGRFEEAEALFHERLAEDSSVQRESRTFGITNNNLAYLYESWDRLDDAEVHNDLACNVLEKTIGKENKYYAHALNVRGDIMRKRRRYPEALSTLEEALRIQRISVAEKHPHTALICWSLAETNIQNSSLDEAAKYAKAALEIRQGLFTAPHPKIASSLQQLAELANQQRDSAASARLLQEAKSMLQAHQKMEATSVEARKSL